MTELIQKIKTDLGSAATAPCGCPACDDGVQQGHFACSQPKPIHVQLEQDGYLSRDYNGTSWAWELTGKGTSTLERI